MPAEASDASASDDSDVPLSEWYRGQAAAQPAPQAPPQATPGAPPPPAAPAPLTGFDPLLLPGQLAVRPALNRLRYNALYLRHRKDAFRLRRSRSPRRWAWWRAWTQEERALFFRGLARHSRLRPELVAATIGTRSTAEVCDAVVRFDRLAACVRAAEREGHVEARQRMLARTPAAREMSGRWLFVEETFAQDMCATDEVVAASMRPHALVAGTCEDAAFNLCQFLTPGCVLPSGPHTHRERLAALYARVAVNPFAKHTVYTPAYCDHMLQYALPALRTQNEFLTHVLHSPYYTVLDASGRPVDPRRTLKMAVGARLAAHVHYTLRADVPPTRDAALERLAAYAVPPRAPVPLVDWRRAPPLTHAVLRVCDAQVRAFVTRVIYELVVVGERARAADVSAESVWAALALLGAVRTSTYTPLVAAAAAERMRADPPLAFGEPPPVRDDTRIGALRTLVPAEYPQIYPVAESLPPAADLREQRASKLAARRVDYDEAAADAAADAADAAADTAHEAFMYAWITGKPSAT